MVLIIAIAFILAFLFWFQLLGKMGYEGTARWMMTIMWFFPPTASILMIYLAFFRWPIQKELKELREIKARLRDSSIPLDEIGLELDRMRGEMGVNQMKGKQKRKDK